MVASATFQWREHNGIWKRVGEEELLREQSLNRIDSPLEKVRRAKARIPEVQNFPHLLRALHRALEMPHYTIYQHPAHLHEKETRACHAYSPVERGQILTFAWWVYVNRGEWGKRKKAAVVPLLSPLMLFNSFHLEMITGLSRRTVERYMTKSNDMPLHYVQHTCEMEIIQEALFTASQGDEEFRNFVTDLASNKIIHGSMAQRLFGVPVRLRKNRQRGVQFTPLFPDLHTLSVRTRDEVEVWLDGASEREKELLPRVYGQDWVREAFSYSMLGEDLFTSTPVPREGEPWYHLCIPGIPSKEDAQRQKKSHKKLVEKFESTYGLPFHEEAER